jgi:hypothetical protein
VTGTDRKNINFRAPTDVAEAADHAIEEAGWTREALLVACLAAMAEHPDPLLRVVSTYRPEPRLPGRPRRDAA